MSLLNQNDEMKREPKTYICGYCQNVFIQKVRRSESKNERGGGSACSDQVVCPACGNFLPTWDKKERF